MPEITTPQTTETAPAPAQTTPRPPVKPNGGRKKKKMVKNLIILAVVLALLAAGGFALYRFLFSTGGEEGEIFSQPAFLGSIQSKVSGSGTAKAKESAAITLTQSGTVQEVFVTGGQTVMAGDPLYTIYSQAAQDAVTDAKEELNNLLEDMADLQEEAANLTVRAPFAGKLQEVKEFHIDDEVSKSAPVATLVNDKKLKLSLYFSYAYEKQNGTAPLFRFDVITKTKNPGCESHYTSRGFHDFRRFEALANRAQYAINKGVFLPNETSFACGECPYRDRCRTWHLKKWR